MWTVMDSPDRRPAHRRARRRDHRDRVLARSATTTAAPRGDRDRHHPVLVEARRAAARVLRPRPQGVRPAARPGRQRLPEVRLGPAAAIGYGDTASYGEIARRLGKSNAASRAVGLANGSNPIPIVIPCHRVIGADGTLTGYAGGIERKQTLLEIEQDALF